jgi:hypothetical protein
MKKYLCWFTHEKPYVPYETMVERMVGSTSTSSNVCEVVDDNSNPYKSIVMDLMRIDLGYVGKCSSVDEEPNIDAIRFLELFKDFDKLFCDGCINHSKLLFVTHVFTIRLDHWLSEAGCDRYIKWAKSILPERNKLKRNFYIAKFMMKLFGLRY